VLDITEGLLAAAVIAVAVAGFARHRGWGIALPVLVVGILVGILPFGPQAPANAGEIFLVILAPLVFGEALSASYRDLRHVGRSIMALAVGLVVVGSLAVGFIATLIVPNIPWAIALALGAILAPTDAVAVAAVAKRAGLPGKVVHVLEGESLVNDGTGLTLLRVALVIAAAGSVTAAEVVGVLSVSILGGVLVGVLVGLILVLLIRRSNDPLVANAAILLAPFPGYFIAEVIDGSGILAVVVAALIAAHGMTADSGFRGRPASIAAWRQITFILQAWAFFLIGLELPASLLSLRQGQWGILIGLVAAVLATLIMTRFLFVALMRAFSGRSGISGRGWIVIGWAGARGPVSGLAAFTLPVLLDSGTALPDRNLLLATTLSVIVITLFLSPTLAPLARRLGLTEDDTSTEDRRVRQALVSAALERLGDLEEDAGDVDGQLPERMVSELRNGLEEQLRALAPQAIETVDVGSIRQRVLIELVRAQQEELIRWRDTRLASDATVRALQHELDLQLSTLKAHGAG
jgi:monovalent cation/hydrogen antiporter